MTFLRPIIPRLSITASQIDVSTKTRCVIDFRVQSMTKGRICKCIYVIRTGMSHALANLRTYTGREGLSRCTIEVVTPPTILGILSQHLKKRKKVLYLILN